MDPLDGNGKQNARIHLVLSGGGVKCLSYVGALAAMTENGITFASVSGISAGSLIGAILCTDGGLKRLQEAVYKLDVPTLGSGRRWMSAIRQPFARYRESRIADVFREIVGGDPRFDELLIPFATFGVDFGSGKIHVYSRNVTPRMRVTEALRLSTAAPFLFPPVQEGERLLLDGAVVSMCPVWLATMYRDELPILVLRPERRALAELPKNPLEYVAELISTAGSSRDAYLISDIPRARLT